MNITPHHAQFGASIRLTARECDVIALLAEGYTNRQISGRLFISLRTVETHVENILNKLGLETRVAAAIWATRQRIL